MIRILTSDFKNYEKKDGVKIEKLIYMRMKTMKIMSYINLRKKNHLRLKKKMTALL